MGRNLFAGDSDNERNDVSLKTNREYAKSYNNIKRKELLRKFKDQKEESSSGSDSESESDYSEDELIHNPEFDQQFLIALNSLKSKDPKIYDKNTQFFEGVEVLKPTTKGKKDKQFTLKEYERKLVENGGVFEDEDSDGQTNKRPQSPSYVEEQEKLKAEFRKVIHNDADSEEEEFGGIFKKKEDSIQEDEKPHSKWLAGRQIERKEKVQQSFNPLKDFWKEENIPKQEKFLRDYIINNGYVDGEEVNAISNYNDADNCDNLSEDEKELEKQSEFEHKFNFRFEEPDKEFIKRYPRTIENSVRKTDDKRKQKREEIKQRKEKEKKEKFKEIEILKAIKKKEIEEKIQKLKEVTGNDDLPFQDNDIDEEFDPEAHDKRMRELFNDEYYAVEEGEEKPECPDIEDLKVEDWDNYDPQNDNYNDEAYNYEPHCEDEDFNMDDDYDPNNKQSLQDELIENTRGKKNRRRRRNRFMEMIKQEKPPFNPEDEKSYEDYIEEYYKMDCEDIIDDIPCRFKYVETVPNDFGLTIEEILLAKTKELNQWASLKKAVQIRPEYEEKKDQRLYKMKGGNEALKRKIFVSLYGPQSEDNDDNNEDNISKTRQHEVFANDNTQKKNKKANTKSSEGDSLLNDDNNGDRGEIQQDNSKEKKKKKKKKNSKGPSFDTKSNANNLDVKERTDTQSQSNSQNELKEIVNKEEKSEKQHIVDEVNILRRNKKSDKTKNKLGENEKSLSKRKIKNQQFKAKKNLQSSGMNISKDRLKAYGINPRKFIKKQNFFTKNKK